MRVGMVRIETCPIIDSDKNGSGGHPCHRKLKLYKGVLLDLNYLLSSVE